MSTKAVVRSRWKRASLSVVVGTLLAACSVTTPRHGETAVHAAGDRLGNQSAAADGGAVAGDGGGDQAVADGGGGVGIGTGAPGTAGSTAARRSGGGGGGGGTSGGGGPSGGATGGGRAGSTVGVTKDSVTVTYSGPWDGPSGELGRRLSEAGFSTWADDVNSNGGIHGRRVIVKYVNNRGTPEGAIGACKEVQSNGSFLVLSGQGNSAFVQCLEKASIPTVAMAVTEETAYRWVRSVRLDARSGLLVAKLLGGPLKGAGKKVGVIYVNQPLYASVAEAFVDAAPRFGMQVVKSEAVANNQGTFTSELLRLRDAGAEAVAMFVLIESVGVLRDAKAIGYAPTFTGPFWCIDEITAGGTDLFRGITCLRLCAGSDTPSYATYRQTSRRHGHSPDTTAPWCVYGQGQLLGDLLKAAGPSLTREGFLSAFDGFGPYNNTVLPPMHWAPREVVGGRSLMPVMCCAADNTWVNAGPPIEDR